MILYFDNNGNTEMEIAQAVDKLTALAQETRLSVFRLLVEAGPDGMNAGAIATALGIPAATLSFHVAQLTRAGLVESRQESRFIYYSAAYSAMDDLIAYLTDNCCQGGQCLPKTRQVATTTQRRTRAKAGEA
jgi:DNA-binding transcriptional ArsR family regulator